MAHMQFSVILTSEDDVKNIPTMHYPVYAAM